MPPQSSSFGTAPMSQPLLCTRGPSSCCPILSLALALEPRNPPGVLGPVPSDYALPPARRGPSSLRSWTGLYTWPHPLSGPLCIGLIPPPPRLCSTSPPLSLAPRDPASPPMPTLLYFPAISLCSPGSAPASGPLKLTLLSSSTPPTV